MRLLHVKYIKFVATGGNLASATERKVVNSEVAVKGEQHIVERILSDNKNPKKRYRVGYGFSVKFVLDDATLADKAVFFGGTVTSEVWTQVQDIKALANYDLRLAIYDADTGLLVLRDFTDMNFVGNEEHSFKEAGSGIADIAVEAMSTSDSDSALNADGLTP